MHTVTRQYCPNEVSLPVDPSVCSCPVGRVVWCSRAWPRYLPVIIVTLSCSLQTASPRPEPSGMHTPPNEVALPPLRHIAHKVAARSAIIEVYSTLLCHGSSTRLKLKGPTGSCIRGRARGSSYRSGTASAVRSLTHKERAGIGCHQLD